MSSYDQHYCDGAWQASSGTSLADAIKKAKFIREARLEEGLGNSLVIKEPIGVVGCITPWTW